VQSDGSARKEAIQRTPGPIGTITRRWRQGPSSLARHELTALGTEADCSHGRPSYYAWWETYPSPSNVISGFPVTPGTTYAAEVKYNGSGSFTLTLSGGGHSFSTTRTFANPALSSAEWIAEAPSMCAGSCRVLLLTNFGTVQFSGSSANGKAINDSAWSFDPLTMVTSGLTVKASPSSLDSTGSAFAVTWAHS
jgi:hypothetical protein